LDFLLHHFRKINLFGALGVKSKKFPEVLKCIGKMKLKCSKKEGIFYARPVFEKID